MWLLPRSSMMEILLGITTLHDHMMYVYQVIVNEFIPDSTPGVCGGCCLAVEDFFLAFCVNIHRLGNIICRSLMYMYQ